jgi:hypothetical protein
VGADSWNGGGLAVCLFWDRWLPFFLVKDFFFFFFLSGVQLASYSLCF